MSLLDDIRNIDPEPYLPNEFDRKALHFCNEYVDRIIAIMKYDVQHKQYKTTSTHKQWSGTLPLITCEYNPKVTYIEEFWQMDYSSSYLRNYYVYYKNGAIPHEADNVPFTFGTITQEKAEYFTRLVVSRLEQEGFACTVDIKDRFRKKGMFGKIKRLSVSYCIQLSIQW